MLAKVPRSVGSGGGKGLWRATFMARAGGHRNSVIQTRFFDRRPLSGYIVEYHVSSIGWNGRCFQEGAKFKKTRSEEHTSELQSLMRISYAVFCLKKKKKTNNKHKIENSTECK